MLIQINNKKFDILLNIIYSTANNFTNKKIYKTPVCYLHQEAARKLKSAIDIAATMQYKIKIYDAFRPLKAQYLLWNFLSDEKYISNPHKDHAPLTHCRGIALDLTIVDENGNELNMGTAVDSMSELSHITNHSDINKEALNNRLLLRGIMTAAGFEGIDTQWWHFQLPNYTKYTIIQDTEQYVEVL